MTITLRLPPETEKRLQECAAATGLTVEGFLQRLVEQEVSSVNGGQPASRSEAKKSLDEVLAPVRDGFQKSGMTDAELAGLVNEVREDIWLEKKAREAQ